MALTFMLFPEGKYKAITFSYDDVTVHDRRLVELMNQYHVKGTFNVISGWLDRVETIEVNGHQSDNGTIRTEELKELYKGHEVASHAYQHPDLLQLDSGAITYEILKDRDNLEKMVGYQVRGFAYPYGRYNSEIKECLKACGIKYARTVCDTLDFAVPQDFLEWHPTCHHDNSKLMELAKQFCEEVMPFQKTNLFYVWGHSFEFDRNQNWEVMEKLLQYIQPYSKNIWTATNIEIYNYVQAYHQLEYTVDGLSVYNPTLMDVWLERENKVYKISSGTTVQFE